MFHHSKESNKPGKNSPTIAHVHLFPNTYLGLKKRVFSFSGFRWESLLGKKKKINLLLLIRGIEKHVFSSPVDLLKAYSSKIFV